MILMMLMSYFYASGNGPHTGENAGEPSMDKEYETERESSEVLQSNSTLGFYAGFTNMD